MPNIVILGSGMGGFLAAYRFHAEGITPAASLAHAGRFRREDRKRH
jgi:2-polyprenyl-6-methoxyphenol hydroxylase-like FAD-dependent oxidoreductase